MKKALVLFVIALSVFSCKRDNCTHDLFAPVSRVTGSSSCAVNQVINLTVFFGCNNGCGQFGHFEETQDNNIRTIKVIAHYTGCTCTMDFPTRTTNYTFKTESTGTYYLKFMQSDTSFVVDTLTVY